MNTQFRTFQFLDAYRHAALIEEVVDEEFLFEELEWNSEEISGCLRKYSKITILHFFIYYSIAIHYRRHYRKNNDLIEESDISKLEQNFRAYGIHIPAFKYTSMKNEDLGEAFYKWFVKYHDEFSLLWAASTDEVFHILFENRGFLLRFHLSLAKYLKRINAAQNIKRCRRFPVWLVKAVFHRDKGRCVICNVDLTGVVNLSPVKHLDHMVPLHKGGTNDSSNIQLLCARCNLTKAGKSGATSNWYQSWWL
jgi:hypothetical protein